MVQNTAEKNAIERGLGKGQSVSIESNEARLLREPRHADGQAARRDVDADKLRCRKMFAQERYRGPDASAEVEQAGTLALSDLSVQQPRKIPDLVFREV